MDIKTVVIYILFGTVGVVLFSNFIKIFINIFTKRESKVKSDPLRDEIRDEIHQKIRPNLTSLEGMYEKSGSTESSFSKFVFSIFKDKFSKFKENEKLLEEEIATCCSEYEGAECKESYCLEGAGISCPKA